ncbi:MAG: glycoside hydrolase family 3 N-terminal domain-containing protein, partial [Candidatus Dormibacteria bacterium]
MEGTLAGLSDAQTVGQLLMVELSRTRAEEALGGVASLHAGNVVLNGPGWNGHDLVAAASARLQQLAANNGGVGFLIAGNQEGGEPGGLQVFYGRGFSPIPSALQQGAVPPARLAQEAAIWGSEMAAAGVNLTLAPVLDIVPAGAPSAAIGRYGREYGHSAGTVVEHATAVVRGLSAAGMGVTLKHFPSLGHIAGNTDFTSTGITDEVTTAASPDV